MDLAQLRDVAVRAAHRGGQVVRLARPPDRVEAKGLPGDWVTAVDVASEQAITELLEIETPRIPVVGEERGGRAGDRYWLVDPLDGTTNFLRGFPVVGVSVALVADGRPVAGCVHGPFLGTTYAAARGLGAVAISKSGNPLPIRVAERPPERGVVATGFPFRHKDRLPRYLPMLSRALERFEDLRRPGAAALDLAWTAAGVFDGFFELGLAPWDVAAGGLLVEEAAGVVTDWAGGQDYLSGDILAGAPGTHRALLELAGASPN